MNFTPKHNDYLLTTDDQDVVDGCDNIDPTTLFNDITDDDVEDLLASQKKKKRPASKRRSTLDLVNSIIDLDYEVLPQVEATMKMTTTTTTSTSASKTSTSTMKRRVTLDLLNSMFGQEEDENDITPQYNKVATLMKPVANAMTNICPTPLYEDHSLLLEPLDYRKINDPFETTSTTPSSSLNQYQHMQQQQPTPRAFLQGVSLSCNNNNNNNNTNKTNLEVVMEKSLKSQQSLHDWDKFQMGLKKSHSKTMRLSRKSRKKVITVLKKERNLKIKLFKKMEAEKMKRMKNNTAASRFAFPTTKTTAITTAKLFDMRKASNNMMTMTSATAIPIFPNPFHETPQAA